MRSERWARFVELLDTGLELRPEERADWLTRLAAADAELAGELAEWLARDEEARGFLESPLAPGASWEREAWRPPATGAVLGRYTLGPLIGVGATSIVYAARQADPERTVALKVFQSGLAGPRARERFAEEAGILASLRHPAIAQVFEAGAQDEGEGGRAWIAIELVEGARTITRYAQEEGLDLRSRLELFALVAEAVAHGHGRGVIHRDLKPANLLVDAGGQPKVIDFGVALVLERGAAQHPGRAAGRGDLLGTLPWMSPEQLGALDGGSPRPVDTRIDVYALGVVLYELVCGRRPQELDGADLEESLRRLQSASPPRPRQLVPALDRDLEAILLMALARDPEARYRAAGELEADLRRYLARQPVQARPPSLAHHLRLTLTRHRAATLVGAAAVLLLGSGLWVAVARERQLEQKARADTQAVVDFLVSTLTLASPWEGRGAAVSVREILEDAERRLADELAELPGARAELHAILGAAWRDRGELERAREQMQRAVAQLRLSHAGSAPLANVLSMLSDVLLELELGVEAERVLLEAREIQAGATELPDFFGAILTRKLADARRLQGDLVSADRLAREALASYRASFGSGSSPVAAALATLAAIQEDAGSLLEARRTLREVIEIQRGASGDESLATARTRLALGELLVRMGDPAKAREELRLSRPVLERLLPDGHPTLLRVQALLPLSAPTPGPRPSDPSSSAPRWSTRRS